MFPNKIILVTALFKTVLLAVIILSFLTSETNCKSQFTQPLNLGLQMAVPYDLANVFHRPIAAATSVIIAGSLAAVLFFGVITSPFGYMFGIPSRKYVLGNETIISNWMATNPDQSRGILSDFMSGFEKDDWTRGLDFEDTIFQYISKTKLRDEDCRQLIICHAHSFLRHLPLKAVKWFNIFSRKVLKVTDKYEFAILTGLEKSSKCNEKFPKCPQNAATLALSIYTDLLPKWKKQGF